MQKPGFDPGLTQQFTAPFRRVINKDGTFNVHRRGTTWRDVNPYLWLINMSWPGFLAFVLAGYVLANILFAAIYFSIGTDQLQGITGTTRWDRFLDDFFFSAHTLSTVGYGNVSPKGMAANVVSAFEAFLGVMSFALATGLLFGRVSKPSARVGFSRNILIAPYQDITSLQFRVVNLRRNSLMELEVRTMLMTVDRENGGAKRNYKLLRMERDQVLFLPLTWTIVHPIDSESPLFGKTAKDLDLLQAEFLILIKAYDDTFSQTVLARYSYRHDEIIWGRRFAPAFSVDGEGDLVLEVGKVGELA